MNKKILALLMASSMLFAVGCSLPENEEPYIEEDDGLTDSGIEYAENEKVFKATVTKYDSKKYLEVEIIESNIAFGTYWVLVSDLTTFHKLDGTEISYQNIKPGATIEIVFSGQVMNSYPPQISAKRIYLH